MTRLLIITDAPMIAEGARVLAEASGEGDVVGQAEDLDGLGVALGRDKPDVALLDLQMAGDLALQLLWWLREQAPSVSVIALSDQEDGQDVVAALQAGARGYLPRRVTAAELGQAIRTVQQGGVVLHPLAAANLLQRLQRQPTPTPPPETLTPREREVLRLMVEGLSNKAIAVRLGISEHTVKFHIGAILGKLGAGSRTEAVSIAVRQGLVPL
ncbi:MAG: response regulator transcription factor [Anaerolineae bacterium]